MEPMDFVIAWVDGADPAWQAQRRRYRPDAPGDESRFRDWGTLRYWFRGVRRFAPWARRIHFVTWGHVPSWLRQDHPALRIVEHEDYIPRAYLPTFSSHTIELNIHRIPGLSRQFVFFNDDTFLTGPLRPRHFFHGGLPCDYAVLSLIVPTLGGVSGIAFHDTALINSVFDKRELMRRRPGQWLSPRYGPGLLRTLMMLPFSKFPGFLERHLPTAYRKESFEAVWERFPVELDATCRHRFRAPGDVNQWLVRYWQLASGGFAPAPVHIGRYLSLAAPGERIVREILGSRGRMLCLNDDDAIGPEAFEEKKRLVLGAFERLLPEPSDLERD